METGWNEVFAIFVIGIIFNIFLFNHKKVLTLPALLLAFGSWFTMIFISLCWNEKQKP